MGTWLKMLCTNPAEQVALLIGIGGEAQSAAVARNSEFL